MKLSEAILAGAALRPQAFGAYFTGTSRTDACSCVVGCLYEVTFPGASLAHDAVVNQSEQLCAVYPLLDSEEKLFCPECAGAEVKHDMLLNILIHLNDDHQWTRERIAEYITGLE
jgi:hypothetical protein